MAGLLRNGIIDEEDFPFTDEQKREAAEHNEALFADHPPREDCDICLRPMPLASNEKTYKLCCGKVICDGCIEEIRDNQLKETKGDKCPFCRVVTTSSTIVGLVKKRIEVNDPEAFMILAHIHSHGTYGQQKGRSSLAYIRH